MPIDSKYTTHLLEELFQTNDEWLRFKSDLKNIRKLCNNFSQDNKKQFTRLFLIEIRRARRILKKREERITNRPSDAKDQFKLVAQTTKKLLNHINLLSENAQLELDIKFIEAQLLPNTAKTNINALSHIALTDLHHDIKLLHKAAEALYDRKRPREPGLIFDSQLNVALYYRHFGGKIGVGINSRFGQILTLFRKYARPLDTKDTDLSKDIQKIVAAIKSK